MSFLRTTFQLTYQVSPIFLTGGLFESLNPVGFPIVGLTEALSAGTNDLAAFVSGNFLPTQNTDLDRYFCNFRPLPGSTLIKNDVATYPFFTSQLAANAQVQQPLNVSLLMYCPANSITPYTVKIATMLALQKTLQLHASLGGTFTVMTPAGTYTGCVLTALTDVSTNETNQAQFAYQWDFTQPLITFPTNLGDFNNLMGAISTGVPIQAVGGAIPMGGP